MERNDRAGPGRQRSVRTRTIVASLAVALVLLMAGMREWTATAILAPVALMEVFVAVRVRRSRAPSDSEDGGPPDFRL